MESYNFSVHNTIYRDKLLADGEVTMTQRVKVETTVQCPAELENMGEDHARIPFQNCLGCMFYGGKNDFTDTIDCEY